MREILLRQTHASGRLLPSRLNEVFARFPPRGTTLLATMRAQELRLAITLSLNDDACCAFVLDFEGQGARVKGTAHGRSTDLLVWAFHQLAASLRCTLTDSAASGETEPAPESHREPALKYLSDFEADVLASRRTRNHEDDGVAFVQWLAREEVIALESDAAAIGSLLRMDDAPALYEQLLESDAVADIFVSERELGWLLSRFRARFQPR